MSGSISTDRILGKLDEHLNKNDYLSAERHLLYWLEEAERCGDRRSELLIQNERMGLYRKLGRRDDALRCVEGALRVVELMDVARQVGAATTFLNAATVYKAFGMAERAISLFQQARAIYEAELERDDPRLAGLYNNMALALVDLGRFSEAKALYEAAISVLEQSENSAPEIAITYLNLATAAEREFGLLDADEQIQQYMDLAEALLEGHPLRDGYYAFVCEKCASVFGYYGRFVYEKELTKRARRIYEGS